VKATHPATLPCAVAQADAVQSMVMCNQGGHEENSGDPIQMRINEAIPWRNCTWNSWCRRTLAAPQLQLTSRCICAVGAVLKVEPRHIRSAHSITPAEYQRSGLPPGSGVARRCWRAASYSVLPPPRIASRGRLSSLFATAYVH
jgi:hypothetical protein